MSGTSVATTTATAAGATLVQFSPPTSGMFQFTATLNSQPYTIQVQWNYAGQRWYLNFFEGTNTTGTPAYSSPLVASGDSVNYNIALQLGGPSTVIYRHSTGNFEISP
jgi:hypothetical protein